MSRCFRSHFVLRKIPKIHGLNYTPNGIVVSGLSQQTQKETMLWQWFADFLIDTKHADFNIADGQNGSSQV